MKISRFGLRILAGGAAWIAATILSAGFLSAAENIPQSCTVIGVGKIASADGSVITSHTDCCSECRIQVIPGMTFPKGSLAPVHWGMVYFGAMDNRKALPLGDFGKVIGHIPQVEKTFTYFHTGYSQMNERQLAIGESTCSQRSELNVNFVEGITRQIMTIEQAQVFALQRCSSGREAVRLIGSLPGAGGKAEKSPMATPFLPGEMEKVLRIRHHRHSIAVTGSRGLNHPHFFFASIGLSSILLLFPDIA